MECERLRLPTFAGQLQDAIIERDEALVPHKVTHERGIVVCQVLDQIPLHGGPLVVRLMHLQRLVQKLAKFLSCLISTRCTLARPHHSTTVLPQPPTAGRLKDDVPQLLKRPPPVIIIHIHRQPILHDKIENLHAAIHGCHSFADPLLQHADLFAACHGGLLPSRQLNAEEGSIPLGRAVEQNLGLNILCHGAQLCHVLLPLVENKPGSGRDTAVQI